MTKRQRLLQEAKGYAKAARDIAEKATAAGRDMTDAERTDFQAKMAQANDAMEQANAAKADEDLLAQAAAIAALTGDGAEADVRAQANEDKPLRPYGKSLGQRFTDSAEFKAALAPFKGNAINERTRVQSDPVSVPSLGAKALITGTSDTSAGAFVVSEQSGILEMLGRRPLTIRDLISLRRTGSDAVEYVVQTAHTNAAAFVPEAVSSAPIGDGTNGTATVITGGLKPEGSWAFERRTTVVKTIAEVATATKRSLADVAALEGLIDDELRADLAEKLEDNIIAGNGSGENFTGILQTSGIQGQAKGSDDLFAAARKARTKVRTVGRAVPTAYLFNPVQVEQIDLARENGTTGAYLAGGPFAGPQRTLWGLPIVESEAITAGTGMVADFRKAVMWDREQATVTMTDAHLDYFARNLVAILGEERHAFAVTRPTAFVAITGL